LPDNHRIAETWEVCDRPNGESSMVVNGPLRGKTLRHCIEEYKELLLGSRIIADSGLRFPLLVKLLDVTHALGEQVHQSDELARKQGLKDTGKTEAWFIIRTRPGATVECGNKKGLSRKVLINSVLDGTARSCMVEYSAQAGDALLLYAGTMHYSGGGILMYEIMQNSDAIIGLWPQDQSLSAEERLRMAQEAAYGVHLEDGADPHTDPITIIEANARRTFVVACEHFALEKIDLQGDYRIIPDHKKFFILTCIAGSASISSGPVSEVYKAGNSCLIPARAREVTIAPNGSATLLKAYVPDLVEDVIKPLRALHIDDSKITHCRQNCICSDLSF
jgi:mannose-6-phosphate isomerase